MPFQIKEAKKRTGQKMNELSVEGAGELLNTSFMASNKVFNFCAITRLKENRTKEKERKKKRKKKERIRERKNKLSQERGTDEKKTKEEGTKNKKKDATK